MNQEPGNTVAAYLGLQGFEVVAVVRVRHPRRGQVKIVRVERRDGQHECPDCARRHARGEFVEIEPIRLRDCSIGDLETYLEVRPMRIACCGGTRVERLPFAMPNFRMTRRFFERIAALCTRLPIAVVAEMAKVDGRAIELALGDRSAALQNLRWIGVDEVSRTGGRVYFTIVTNLETGRVVWIGDRKGRDGLVPFLRALGAKEIHVIADNLSAHKTKLVQQFLEEHPRVHLHYTPTYSSWLNQVEIWFSQIERDVIARGIFTSKRDLSQKLLRYIRQYNEDAVPIKWVYSNPRHRIRPGTRSRVTGH